jgi:hypothetical protein
VCAEALCEWFVKRSEMKARVADEKTVALNSIKIQKDSLPSKQEEAKIEEMKADAQHRRDMEKRKQIADIEANKRKIELDERKVLLQMLMKHRKASIAGMPEHDAVLMEVFCEAMRCTSHADFTSAVAKIGNEIKGE